MTEAKRIALAACFDVLTAYMVDECPDDVAWEDFDGDVDALRSTITDLLEGGAE